MQTDAPAGESLLFDGIDDVGGAAATAAFGSVAHGGQWPDSYGGSNWP
ncbi:hypothetical protein [Streptomyces violascens]